MRTMQQLVWFFRKYWKRYTFGIFFLLLVDVLMLLPPRLMGQTVDKMRTDTLTPPALAWTVAVLIGLGLLMYGVRLLWRHQEALHVLARGRTTFMIAHRLSTIQHADLILVLSRGEVVERGTHEELMSLGSLYQKMYLLQQGEAFADALTSPH